MCAATFPQIGGYTRCLAFDPEGAFLAGVQKDGQVHVWAHDEDGWRSEAKKSVGPKVGDGIRLAGLGRQLRVGCMLCVLVVDTFFDSWLCKVQWNTTPQIQAGGVPIFVQRAHHTLKITPAFAVIV